MRIVRGICGAIVALLLLPFSAAGQNPAGQPNVVVILADDLGYGDLSSFGQTMWRTPRIDRMAAEGVRMTNFYVPTPYCGPTRGTLLTGRYPFRHGMVANPAPDGHPRADTVGMPAGEILLSDVLSQAGYATSIVGKWHLGHQPEYLPTRRGFDEYYGIPYSNDMRPVQVLEDETVVEYPVVQASLTRRYTDRALDFIERNRDRPFFLYLAHAMPHKPLAPSPEFYTPETPDDLYADVIRELDWSVGQVLDRLEELGLEENTLVIFLSDNGPWYGGSTGGLRGMKGMTWEGGLRVPMIARWPEVIPAGRSHDGLAGAMDVFPTVLSLLGIPLPDDRVIDGRDIMPMLTAQAPSPHDGILGMRGEEVRTVRDGRWKLHVHSPGPIPDRGKGWVDPRGPDGVTILAPFEQSRPTEYPGVLWGDEPTDMMLFDLRSDPAEQRNVAGEHPEIVSRLRALYDRTQSVPSGTE